MSDGLNDAAVIAAVGAPVWALLAVVAWKTTRWVLDVRASRADAREWDTVGFPVALHAVESGREMWLHRCFSCGEPFWAAEREADGGCDLCSPGGA